MSFTALALFFSIQCIYPVASWSSYVSRIPNGDKVVYKGSTVWAVGHISTGGGGSLNPFGTDFKNNGATWSNICNLDSDNDGFKNFEELGASCDGTITRTTGLSHPGFSDSVPPSPPAPPTPAPPTPVPPTPSPPTPAPQTPAPPTPAPQTPSPPTPAPQTPSPPTPAPQTPSPPTPAPVDGTADKRAEQVPVPAPPNPVPPTPAPTAATMIPQTPPPVSLTANQVATVTLGPTVTPTVPPMATQAGAATLAPNVIPTMSAPRTTPPETVLTVKMNLDFAKWTSANQTAFETLIKSILPPGFPIVVPFKYYPGSVIVEITVRDATFNSNSTKTTGMNSLQFMKQEMDASKDTTAFAKYKVASISIPTPITQAAAPAPTPWRYQPSDHSGAAAPKSFGNVLAMVLCAFAALLLI